MKRLVFFAVIFSLLSGLVPLFSFAANTKDGKDSQLATVQSEVVSYLHSENFAKVTELLDDIEKSRVLTVNGRRYLETLYSELSSMRLEVLDSWCGASAGGSAHPYIVRGNYYLSEVLEVVKGDYYGRATPLKDKNQKKLYLQKAQADLEKAYNLAPENPAGSAGMIAVSKFRGYPKQEVNKWFNRAIAIDSFWLSPYENKLSSLSPYWNGSIKEMTDFVLKCVKESPEGSSVYSLLLSYFDSPWTTNHFRTYPPGLYSLLHMPKEIRKGIIPVVERYKHDFPKSNVPLFYEGKYKLMNGDPGAGIVLFNEILEKEPENLLVLKYRIVANMGINALHKAQSDVETYLAIEPDSSFALSNSGAIQIALHGDIEKGKEHYAQAIRLEPLLQMQKNYYTDLANLLESKSAHKDAVRAFTEVLQIEPMSERALLGRAECLFNDGNLKDAEKDLLEIIDINRKFKGVAVARLEEYRNTFAESVELNHSNNNGGEIRTADIVTSLPESKNGKPKRPLTIDKMMLACEGYFYRKMAEQATDCYSDILATIPEKQQGKPYFMLGRVAEVIEYDLSKASTYFERAVSKDPENKTYIIKLGESLYMQSHFDKALMVFSKLLEMDSTNSDAFYYRGLCFEGKGQRDKAIEDMQYAKLYGSGRIEVDQYLQQYAMKQPDEGKMAMSREQELERLAEDNMMLNRFEEAEKQYKELLELNNGNDYAHFRLGILYKTRDKDNKKAIEKFDNAIRINPNRSDYFFNRAFARKATGDLDGAIADFTSTLKFKPLEDSLYTYRAECFEKKGDFQNAEKDLKKALELSPGDKWIMGKLAKVAMKTGSAETLESNDPLFFMERGKAYLYKKKDYKKAESDFNKAASIDPDNGEPYYLLGKLYEKNLKDIDKAILYYSKAIERDKGKRDYFFQRGLVYFHQKKCNEAIPDLSSALELSENDGQILYYRGYCLQKIGEKDKAIDDFLKVKQYAPSWTDSVNSHLERMVN